MRYKNPFQHGQHPFKHPKKSEKMMKNQFTPDGLTEKKNFSIGPGIVSQIQQMLMSEQFPEIGSLVQLLVM